MKNTVSKFYIALFYFCSTLMLFAQPGDGNGGTGDGALEGNDPSATPIDDYLWLLVIVGLVFVFMKIRAIQKNSIQKK